MPISLVRQLEESKGGCAMQKMSVYLASWTEQENRLLQKKLEALDIKPRCQYVSSHPNSIHAAATDVMSLVVFNFNEWTARESHYLNGLRLAGYEGPALVITKTHVAEATKEIGKLDQVVFLEKPFDLKDLTGVIQKMLSARAVAQRFHRRFNTEELAEVEFLANTGSSVISSLRNISKGGAYLELLAEAPANVGDMVRLKVELKAVNRTYTMPAKIVWTSPSESGTGTAIGVEFIGRPSVESSILGAA